MKHLIDILQLSTQEIDELVAKANSVLAGSGKTCFYVE